MTTSARLMAHHGRQAYHEIMVAPTRYIAPLWWECGQEICIVSCARLCMCVSGFAEASGTRPNDGDSFDHIAITIIMQHQQQRGPILNGVHSLAEDASLASVQASCWYAFLHCNRAILVEIFYFSPFSTAVFIKIHTHSYALPISYTHLPGLARDTNPLRLARTSCIVSSAPLWRSSTQRAHGSHKWRPPST